MNRQYRNTSQSKGLYIILGALVIVVIFLAVTVLKGNHVTVLEKNAKTVKIHDTVWHHRYTKPRNYKPYAAYVPSYMRENTSAGNASPAKEETKERQEKPTAARQELVLDLNRADTLDLQMLRGVGPFYARMIYNYREKLGGFVSLQQLREVYRMNDTLYQMIVPHLKIGSANIRKININTNNLKSLSSHPYIDYYLAKEIITLGKSLGGYTDVNQLRLIHLMDEKTFSKLKPYLSTD